MVYRALFAAGVLICLPTLMWAAEPGPFDKGAWTLELDGAYMESTALGDVNYGAPSVGVGYYLFDNFAQIIQLATYQMNAEDDHEIAGGINFGLRYHLFRVDRLTFYADVYAGMFYASDEIPVGGTHFNFITRSGFGITYELRENLHLNLGGRFVHISNARIDGDDRNPSTNGVEGFLGVIWTF
jgi:hypothetical protein